MFSKIITVLLLVLLTNITFASESSVESQMSCQELEQKIEQDRGVLDSIKATIKEFKEAWNKFLYCLTSDDLRCVPNARRYHNVSWDLHRSQISLRTKTEVELIKLQTEYQNRCQ